MPELVLLWGVFILAFVAGLSLGRWFNQRDWEEAAEDGAEVRHDGRRFRIYRCDYPNEAWLGPRHPRRVRESQHIFPMFFTFADQTNNVRIECFFLNGQRRLTRAAHSFTWDQRDLPALSQAVVSLELSINERAITSRQRLPGDTL